MYIKKCRYCNGKCIKYGFRKNKQRYLCGKCGKIQQFIYEKKLEVEIDSSFVKKLHKVGLGITGIAEVMGISKTTVQRKLIGLARGIKALEIAEQKQVYEVDELKTCVGNKNNECWIMYAMNRRIKQIIDVVVGRRTKENIKKITDKLLLLNPKKIVTDGLNIYPGLLPDKIHKVSEKIMSVIERNNLTLRTRIKVLSRKTLCYSRSENMLRNHVLLYMFG